MDAYDEALSTARLETQAQRIAQLEERLNALQTFLREERNSLYWPTVWLTIGGCYLISTHLWPLLRTWLS
jgi:hypothetical protein